MKKEYLLVTILFLVIFTGITYADQISFGSYGSNKRVTMIPGEVKEFKNLAFFNYGNNPIVVEIEKSGSDEILVIVDPKYFELLNNKEVNTETGEIVNVLVGENYLKAVRVRVFLKVPNNITELTKNYHIIKIVAKASSEEAGPSGIREKVSQAREYTYAITVPGNVNANTMEEYNISLEQFYQELATNKSPSEEIGGSFWNIGTNPVEEKNKEQRGQLPTGFFSLGGNQEGGSFTVFHLIMIVVALILFYFVYKRFRR